MNQQQPRRSRGSTKGYLGLFAKVQPEHHAKAHRMAAAMDISLGALVDLVLEHVEVDEHNRPSWADELDRREELPLAG